MRDPRDAALAAAWAERLTATAERTPGWLLPLTRPNARRARLWVVHAVWLTLAVVYAYVRIWSLLTGVWRWMLLGFLVYSALALPFTLRRTLRAYWNAPEAARKNKLGATDAPAR